MPKRNKLSSTIFDVISHNDAILDICNMFLALALSSNLDGIRGNAEIRIAR